MKGLFEKLFVPLVIYIALLPLVYIIPDALAEHIENRLAVTAVSLAMIVPVISFWVLPKSIKWKAGLFKQL